MINSLRVKSGSFCVVTPNLNMGKYLAETIESVLENLGPNDQYYVIDGGSDDDSVEILKNYSDRITGWISEKDAGYANAVNKGLKKGQSEFQCWIGSGDLLLKGALNNARAALSNSCLDMIFGDDLYIDDLSRVVRYSSGRCSNLFEAMLFGDWTPLQDACFWRTSLYNKVGGLNPNLRNAADYDLFAKFSVAGKVGYVPILFSAFRRHEHQRSIKFMDAYRSEKKYSKNKILEEIKLSPMEKIFKRVKNYLYIRWRSRVLHRIWNVKSLKNKEALLVQSKKYL